EARFQATEGGSTPESRRMTAAGALERKHERLKPLIDFIIGEGWEVVRTRSGHLQFAKHGLPLIYTGTTALACQCVGDARPRLREANRTPDPDAAARKVRADG